MDSGPAGRRNRSDKTAAQSHAEFDSLTVHSMCYTDTMTEFQKQCTKCKTTKSVDEFPRRGKSYSSWCKECKRAHDRYAYQNNIGQGDNRRQRLYENRAAKKQEHRQIIWEYLLLHPCVDCGESDPIVLEFDHVRGIKVTEVSAMIGSNTDKLLLEIAKCDIRCCNCHKRRTAKEGNYWYHTLVD